MTIGKAIILTISLPFLFYAFMFIFDLVEFDLEYYVHLYSIFDIISRILSYFIVIFYLKKTFPDSNRSYRNEPINGIILGLILIIALGEYLLNIPFFDWKQNSNLILDTNYEIPDYSDDSFNSIKLYKIFSAIIVAPILEEIIFRFYIFRGLLKTNTFWNSLIISSIMFSFIHISSPRNIIPTFIFGLISGIIYYKTKNIKYPIFLHLISNALWSLTVIFAREYSIIHNFIGFGVVYWGLFIFGVLTCIIGIKKLEIKAANNK